MERKRMKNIPRFSNKYIWLYGKIIVDQKKSNYHQMRLRNGLLKKKNSKSEIQLVYKFMKGQIEVTYNWK